MTGCKICGRIIDGDHRTMCNSCLAKVNNDLENRFTNHAPKPGQPAKYEELRGRAKELAYIIEANCPNSRERSLALTKLEEAVFWANAAIARNE